ncbi:unnamed protein product [Tilletia laevis]|uniref:Endonuclease/exonuclease/phosphatase domain-containing protein n=3 Tax=Tilletia TaxID=13289 RepID=A0A8X7MJQ7_9BASI|nr:hypothetical protein CF335_g7861 [Tilletia laevis]KAE8186644.1 hypothetical protein CF328_g7169 [Tilletia controversa]KAE8243124.1 hypothetical protein A4X03_0g7861 [Tilletia caries]KAE8238164.1 hypothetical protein A4X06_0g8964 [Tilletia controversa]CAD6888354.1 unnamed protein product [Tilletia caries]
MCPQGHSGAGGLPTTPSVQPPRQQRGRGGAKHRKTWSGGIRILEASVGRGERSTEAALSTADQIGADVVMLQEPRLWWSEVAQEWVPRSWLNYEAILPTNRKTNTLPRVLTYVKRNHPRLTFVSMQQVLLETSADILVVDALGARGGRVRLVNLYSAPLSGNCVRPGRGVRDFSAATLAANQIATFVAGNFNAHHRNWSDPSAWNKRSPAGIKLAS